MTIVGNIIPAANKPRSQWEDYLKRRQFGDEGVPTKTDEDGRLLDWNGLMYSGTVVFYEKRADMPNEMPIAKREADPHPAVYMPRDGTNLQDPVKMDRFGILPLKYKVY